ncbi:MAG: ABC transporter substrate binding protein [Gammaproteobacteria bacterium]
MTSHSCAPSNPALRRTLALSVRAAAALLCAGGLPLRARAEARAVAIAVVFPDIGEPFRKVFTDIIGGIEDEAHGRVHGFPVSASQDPAELAAAVRRAGARVVVALGRQGLRAAAGVELPVVVSGVSSVPDGERQTGICLTPDPALLFGQLKALAPQVRRVLVVYNPQHNEWLLRLARDAARAAGLELNAMEARDLASAARLYENAFAGMDGKREALWLPIDPTTVDEATILPIVLREAWNRSVAVFSSSFLHVKRGALFALYPNNVELGRNLGSLATGILAGEAPPRGVSPLRDVYSALNLRTASHIGLSISPRVQRSFTSLYPEP